MGEGCWVEVWVRDAKKGEKALNGLRKELAGEEFLTQGLVTRDGEMAIAVALAGVERPVSALVAVLRDWLKRWSTPCQARLTVQGESIELDRSAFDEQQVEAFLTKSLP